MAASKKTLKDIGIFFTMVIVTVLIMAVISYPLDFLLALENAKRFNETTNSFYVYIVYYLFYRAIFIMPIFWLFVEVFDGKMGNKLMLKILFIIVSATLVALITQGDMSVNIQTEYKRFFTYPVAGLLAYLVYAKCFYRNQS